MKLSALIASSPRQIRRLFQIAEEDSLERGYRFNPTKCVVVGADGIPSACMTLRFFVSLHSTIRILRLIIAVLILSYTQHQGRPMRHERLQQAGARFKNFPFR